MPGIDMGKQVGPLPLGAWFVVVAGGLGIALYTRRQQGTAPAEIVDNTSGDAGVGTGAVGGFVSTVPTGTVTTPVAVPTTNDEWGAMVYNGLIASNYPPTTVDGMVKKYLAGTTSTMSPAENALLAIALAKFGGPPQILPPDGAPPVVTPPVTPVAPKSTLPAGPYRYMITSPTYRTVPTIAQRWHMTSAAVLAYNPDTIVAKRYDQHHLPLGIIVRLPR